MELPALTPSEEGACRPCLSTHHASTLLSSTRHAPHSAPLLPFTPQTPPTPSPLAPSAVLSRQVGGFDFDLLHRNERLMATLGAGAKLPKTRKTGTTICGAIYAGGVVLGADTRATEDSTVRSRPWRSRAHVGGGC